MNRKLFTLALALALLLPALALAQFSQPVRDVENPARTFFYSEGSWSQANQSVILKNNQIPAGYVLVVEKVSFKGIVKFDPPTGITLFSSSPGTPSLHVPVKKETTYTNQSGSVTYYAGSESGRAYFDGGTNGASLDVLSIGLSLGFNFDVSIHGYLFKK